MSIKQSNTFLAQNKHQPTMASLRYFDQNSDARAPLEQLIYTVYKKYYHTDITNFYPNLISIEEVTKNNAETKVKAVAGVRCAAEQALFSEYYLSRALETELKAQYGHFIDRNVVVEIGNLAPANIGQMRWLIASITAFLQGAGFKYIVFTLVAGVYNAFKRMGLDPKQIAKAKKSSLPQEIREQWGHEYYQLNPTVFTGDIQQGYHIMRQSIYQSNQKLIPLFEQAYQLGCELRLQKECLQENAA